MKNKSLWVILAVGLMLLGLSAPALGAVHVMGGDFGFAGMGGLDAYQNPSVDTWFSVDGDETYFNATAVNSDSDTVLDFQFYINDQTFLELGYFDFSNNVTTISGSYLFDFGLFLGVEAISQSDDQTLFSPGYRINIGDHGYVALSVDYLSGGGDSGIYGYDLDVKYRDDKVKVLGQAYHMCDEGNFYALEGAFKVAENIVVGAEYEHDIDENEYAFGLTWDADRLIFDGQLGHFGDDEDFYRTSAMFKLGESFRLGAEYDYNYYTSEHDYGVKLNYEGEKNAFGLMYFFKHDNYDDMLWVTYTQDF